VARRGLEPRLLVSRVVYLGEARRRIGAVEVMPWQEMLRELDAELE